MKWEGVHILKVTTSLQIDPPSVTIVNLYARMMWIRGYAETLRSGVGGNSDENHVLDIEEVLHYCSRLTCPAYCDIVDRFFTVILANIFLPYVVPYGFNSRTQQHVMEF
ncbi:hypothetical protein Ancab_020078 [Ancistrocladus abbreviatus]